MIKTEGEDRGQIGISGWYTDISWSTVRGFKTSNGNSFIFIMNDVEELNILRCKKNRNEVYHDKYRLCWFGTNDLRI